MRVPPLIVSAPNADPADRLRFPVPERVTDEPVPVKLEAEDVSHVPVPIVMRAEANVRVAAPLEVRLFAPKLTVALVRVRTPLHVSEPLKLEVTPGLTVRLSSVCGILIVPPEALTTIVEVPTEKVPNVVSMDVTVIVDPFAARVPFAATVRVEAPISRFAALVSSPVAAVPPPMLKVPATISPRAASVNVTAEPPESKTTFANSGPLRLLPANVIVCAEEELNVTVAVPGDQEADVLAFVQDPEKVHDPDPKAR